MPLPFESHDKKSMGSVFLLEILAISPRYVIYLPFIYSLMQSCDDFRINIWRAFVTYDEETTSQMCISE